MGRRNQLVGRGGAVHPVGQRLKQRRSPRSTLGFEKLHPPRIRSRRLVQMSERLAGESVSPTAIGLRGLGPVDVRNAAKRRPG